MDNLAISILAEEKGLSAAVEILYTMDWSQYPQALRYDIIRATENRGVTKEVIKDVMQWYIKRLQDKGQS